MDIMFTLLDHGYDDLERIDSAEFVLNHSQRISVVTGTSSVYGVLEETRLTSTHPIQPSEARDHPRQRSRKTLRRGGYTSRSMGSNFYTRALRGCPPSRSQPENTHAPGPSGLPTGRLRYLPL